MKNMLINLKFVYKQKSISKVMENIFKSLKQVINFAAHRLYPVSRRVVSANLILKIWDWLPAFNQKNSHRFLPLIKRFEGLTMHPCHLLGTTG